MIEDFLKWLDDNDYLKYGDWDYEIIKEQYVHSNKISWIKSIINQHFLISNSMVWYDEWENTYKCTFSVNWFKDIDTETLNEKFMKNNYKIVNIKVKKVLTNPFSISTSTVTSYVSNRNKFDYTIEIGEIDDTED